MTQTEKTVLIMEDHRIVAAGVADVISEKFPGMQSEVAYTFPDGLSRLAVVKPVALIILDVKLPGGDGVRMLQRLREIQPGVRILIFSALTDSRDALTFLSAGADGYAPKTLNLTEVSAAIATVLAGKRFMSEELRKMVSDSFFQDLRPASQYADIGLSPREREALELFLAGKDTKEICMAMDITFKTVSGYKAKIFDKLGVSNMVDLVSRFDRADPH